MKFILNFLLTNRISILIALNIAVVIWIPWYERGVEYEALLDSEYKVLSEMEMPTIPLNETICNMMIVAIIINIIVLAWESIKKRKKRFVKYDLMITFTYFSLVMFCMLLGAYYLSTKINAGIINENNPLFEFPIMILGKDLFTSIVTVTRLYISLCVIHLSICLFNLYLCIERYESGGRRD